MSEASVLTVCGFLFWTLTSIGMIFDKDTWAWKSEFCRAAAFLFLYLKLGAWNEFMIPYEILIGTFSVSLTIASISLVAEAWKGTKVKSV